MPSNVFPVPVLPLSSVIRFLGIPPSVISSNPLIPVKHFLSPLFFGAMGMLALSVIAGVPDFGVRV
jgi:hypothetical protein